MEQTHGPSVTMLRVPLVGNLRYAKSGSTGSHISVDAGGRYSPTELSGLLVIYSEFLGLHKSSGTGYCYWGPLKHARLLLFLFQHHLVPRY